MAYLNGDMSIVEWNEAMVFKKFYFMTYRNMENACKWLRYIIRTDFKKHYPPASRPGQIPHVRTGTLDRSIDYEIEKGVFSIAGWVGARADAFAQAYYAIYLEIGTSRMMARPYLRPGLQKARPKIKQLLTGNTKGVKF